jgi:exonuclease SbcC
VLQDLYAQKNLAEMQVRVLSGEIDNDNIKLVTYYDDRLVVLGDSRKELQRRLNLDKLSLASSETTLEDLKKRRLAFSVELKGFPSEEYQKQQELALKNAIDNRAKLSGSLTELQTKISELKQTINGRKSVLVLIENEVQNLRKDEKYSRVLDWFVYNNKDGVVEEEFLLNTSRSVSGDFDLASVRLEEVENKMKFLRNELSIFNKETLLDHEKELLSKLQSYDERIIPYMHFVKDKLGIDALGLQQQDLTAMLDRMEKEFKAILKKLVDLREEYMKLEKYSQNLFPFLQSETAKMEQQKKREDLNFLTGTIKKLIDDEMESTKKYLDQRVRNFFFEDLINDLYRKIDPHPDFKSVEFKAVFDSDSPRLDVFVRTGNEENALIPNLYFSTAQINILSLCIFLASALNSKEYDCIFIDDPIQSMDSINVLSTIDLLRSIAVNTGKQIILSTHDENFHNLLKKKIPSGLFNSKFLELSTFGKVKKETETETETTSIIES